MEIQIIIECDYSVNEIESIKRDIENGLNLCYHELEIKEVKQC